MEIAEKRPCMNKKAAQGMVALVAAGFEKPDFVGPQSPEMYFVPVGQSWQTASRPQIRTLKCRRGGSLWS